jgi:hypothetical protein
MHMGPTENLRICSDQFSTNANRPKGLKIIAREKDHAYGSYGQFEDLS